MCTCAVLVLPYLLSILDIRHEEQAMNRTYNMNLEVGKHVHGDVMLGFRRNPAVAQHNSET